MTIIVLLLAIAAGCAQAAICPQATHTVCNSDVFEYRCVCAMSLAAEPAPEQSCNGIVSPDDDFRAVSVTFKLDDSAEHHKLFPEARFRQTVASSLRIDQDQIIVLRAKCANDDTELIVQFAVKKKDSEDPMPFTYRALINASSVTSRMKAHGHLSQLADLEVDKIEEVDQLVPVEGVGDNVKLGIIALVVGVGIIISCALGIFNVMRQNRYSDIDAAR